MQSNIQIILNFVNAINEKNIEKLRNTLSEFHIFIDAQGHMIQGINIVENCWINYFKLFPDFNIEITDILVNDQLIAVFGYSSGTYNYNFQKGEKWVLPTSWKVILSENKISKWQVYADTKIPFDTINKFHDN